MSGKVEAIGVNGASADVCVSLRADMNLVRRGRRHSIFVVNLPGKCSAGGITKVRFYDKISLVAQLIATGAENSPLGPFKCGIACDKDVPG